jgi:hypothetical protein
LIVEGRVTLLGKQDDKKMKSGIQFFAVNLFADPKSAPKLGKLGRRMGAEEWLDRIISVTGRLRTPSSASLSMTNSAETPGKKMGGKKGDGFSCQ